MDGLENEGRDEVGINGGHPMCCCVTLSGPELDARADLQGNRSSGTRGPQAMRLNQAINET